MTGSVDQGETASTVAAWTQDLLAWLKCEASAASFDCVGVAAVDGLSDETEARDAERFEGWIDAGRAGEMDYLKRRDTEGLLLRSAVQVPMPWARSVIVCALNYYAAGPLSIDAVPTNAGWIARYAWAGRGGDSGDLLPADYHDYLLRRLHRLERAVQERTGAETRAYVDTGPLVERSLASRAGIGWIGKNTCVLSQELGSWMLLATIVTSLPVPPDAVLEEVPDRCGSCTRCIDACPTEALVAPREMDATRCIAYLTIEKKGPIAEDLRAGMGRQIFGCDICQEVCPWNRGALDRSDPEVKPSYELVNPDLEELARLTPGELRARFRGSPLERTGPRRLRRNVAIAMGNSGEPRFAASLDRWSDAEDPVLADAAQWARARLRERTTPDRDVSRPR